VLHAEAAADAFAVAPVLGLALARATGCHWAFRFFWAVNDLGGMLAAVGTRHWLDASLFAAAGLLALLGDWWNRKGKRAAKTLGAKSQALIGRPAGKLGESPEPVPEGAGA
jgi:hypothetical protein